MGGEGLQDGRVLELLGDVSRDVLRVLGGRGVVALAGSWRVRAV